jgi:hypothetical protein
LILTIAIFSLIFAMIPAVLFYRNLAVFSTASTQHDLGADPPLISVLIPARNEEFGIATTIQKVLANDYPNTEIIVLDDHSTDTTRELVTQIANDDPRVQLKIAPPLPAGWCGKQHACWNLAELAKGQFLLFIDADVRLAKSAISRTYCKYISDSKDLISCFPRQETVTIMEKLLIPLIHFVLLGFLSIRTMRQNNDPSFAAGCGQFFFTSKSSYEKSGGHEKIKESLHDGLRLPRIYRESQLTTDAFDGTDIATVRMYRNAKDVWSGLQKNATEGLGSPKLIGPITVLLLAGQVLPLTILAIWLSGASLFSLQINSIAAALFGIALLLSYAPRILGVFRFSQSVVGAILHPLGIAILLVIQWVALINLCFGKGGNWKGRSYSIPKA